MQDDDWKGERFLSAKPKSAEERRFVTYSASSSIAAERKRREGSNASTSNMTWAKQFRGYWKAGGPRT